MNARIATLTRVWVTVALLAGSATVSANSSPEVTNVTASQRTDGSLLVDIGYDLADADGDPCTVTVTVSDDGGSTWDVPAASFTGDIGPDITPGTGKAILWDCGADLPGAYGENYKVRVCANDGHGPGGEMVEVPGGSFEMGDPWNEGFSNELPVHTVYLSPYYIDTYEVTNQQYAYGLNWAYAQGGLIEVTSGVVYQAGTSYPYCDIYSPVCNSRIHWDGGVFTVTAGKEDHSMLEVSWYGSVAYCNWRSAIEGKPLCYDLSTWTCNFGVAGYRLPTEAEWEKAAGWDPVQSRHFRFGEHTDGCGYDCLDGRRANYRYSGDPYETGDYPWTTPVGYYDGTNHDGYQTQNAQSYYGCYDMSGNVWEWCYDWYLDTYYSSSPGSNPTGPASGTHRVLRGGYFDDILYYCRSANRYWYMPDARAHAFGFRCVLGIGGGLRDTACGNSLPFTIDNPAGGCCIDSACADNVTQTVCVSAGGVYVGNWTHCSGQDCNNNGVDDLCDIAVGTSEDCQPNDVPDECDIAGTTSEDCQPNDVPDDCDIAGATSEDCQPNDVPDECETDCQPNGIPDDCDIAEGTSVDDDSDVVPDECDNCDLYNPDQLDCQPNGVGDVCDLAYGTSDDSNGNDIPDECEGRRPMPEDCATIGAGDKCNATGICTTDADCWEESRCVPPPTGEAGSGVCYAPKTRFLSIARHPGESGNTARRVKLDDGTELGWVGEPYYVQPVQEEPPGIYLADIVATPHYEPMWPDVVHVTGCEIAPAALCDVSGIHCKPNSCPAGETCVQHSYYIQAIKLGDDISDESNYSEVLELRTSSTWGDTVSTIVLDNARPPDGIVGIDDIMAAIRKYQHIYVAPITWLDIDPSTGASTPDQRIGLDDVMSYINAYQGGSYPGLGPLNCP